jgi:putative endonuclease
MSRFILIPFKGTDTTPSDSSRLGKFGEDLAVKYLEVRGYTVILRNFTVTLGRNSAGARVTGEIDIVAEKDGFIFFVEVKTRRVMIGFSPEDSIDRRKKRQIKRAAAKFGRIFKLGANRFKYLAVGIIIGEGAQRPAIRLSEFGVSE